MKVVLTGQFPQLIEITETVADINLISSTLIKINSFLPQIYFICIHKSTPTQDSSTTKIVGDGDTISDASFF